MTAISGSRIHKLFHHLKQRDGGKCLIKGNRITSQFDVCPFKWCERKRRRKTFVFASVVKVEIPEYQAAREIRISTNYEPMSRF